MRSHKSLFYFLTVLVLVLVAMVYFDIAVYGGVNSLRPWYYDIIEHLLGGILVSGLFIYYAYLRPADQFPRKFWIALLMTVAFVALAAVFWEFFEFTANALSGFEQNTLADTIKDLAMGLSGAVTGSVFILPKVLKK